MSSRTKKSRRMITNDVYAVILVGGKGKRLRPLSCDKCPKAFLSVERDRKTMFGATLARIRSVIGDKFIVVVANKAHAGLVKKDFCKTAKDNLILEPVSRNTAPAIAMAAERIRSINPNGIMVVLPSDQYVRDRLKYAESVRSCIDFVKKNPDSIVVLGVKPRSPSTQFGYVRVKAGCNRSGKLDKVIKFTEKPDLEKAKKYLRSGKYLWNTGAFVFRADVILKELAEYKPEITQVLKKSIRNMKFYSDMPDISIDYAVMEKAGNVYCYKASYGWSDIGSFDILKKVLINEGRKFIEEEGKIIAIL